MLGNEGSDFTGYDPELERPEEIQAGSKDVSFSARAFAAPQSVDPRKLMRHDKQGSMGSCQGFSLSNCVEYLWASIYGTLSDERQCSQLFCYLESQRFDKLLGRDSGSTIASGLKVAKDVGILPEKFLPYKTPYPTNAKTLVTEGMRKEASRYKIRSWTWLKSYNDVFEYLASGYGAVHTGTLWNDSFYSTNGVLESVNLRGGGGHATAWLGYSERKDSAGRNYIWRLNSHSDAWTEISPKVIDQLFRHEYTSVVGVSDLSDPTPRPIKWLEGRFLE